MNGVTGANSVHQMLIFLSEICELYPRTYLLFYFTTEGTKHYAQIVCVGLVSKKNIPLTVKSFNTTETTYNRGFISYMIYIFIPLA